ncbi:hypothetical protein AC579_10222 [Pseudocercospora musae]|uniref:Uncharacterized protein n=1 Tax=Pseudocercospora musae TaxID=113226 RepID=A0A139HE43_9PEZI|nr:hypothetical protein AC579_10222 [Pseudocercospora musae]
MHEIRPARTRQGRGFDGDFSYVLYWRLDSLHESKSLSRSDLAYTLDRDGYKITNTTSRHDMVQHSTRAVGCTMNDIYVFLALIPFARCTRQELLKFANDKAVKGVRQDSPSESIISKLRDWDEKQTFRYLDLPPELRERIAK